MREDMATTEEVVVGWVVVASLEVGEVEAMVAEVEATVVEEAGEVLHLFASYVQKLAKVSGHLSVHCCYTQLHMPFDDFSA